MDYCSTRDNSIRAASAEAIAAGISKEGGLFVPCEFPQITYQDLCEMETDDYKTRAQKILSRFLTDFTFDEIKECVEKAYAEEKFSSEKIVPMVLLNHSTYVLELWHGPTCAFKDMALQILPHLLTVSMKKVCDGETVVILVATSGDTGKAALEGFKDVENTKILVFYPEDGVSPMQKHQMNTQTGENVSVCAIRGNFDDAQTGVKQIFTSEAIGKILKGHNMRFSSANSINWGRLLPQIVYYFSAYCDIMNSGEMDYKGEKVNIVVPTGNFGNILAAYYAMQMGLPVNKLICASNENNVLTDFIRTGTYDRNRAFHTTISPSMDILISSNLERLLYDLCGRDDRKINQWMNELKLSGRYSVDSMVKEKLSAVFYGNYASDDETKQTIRKVFDSEGYLCDTHTAVAINVYEKYCVETGDSQTPAIIASTASPYKFADAVLEAVTGEKADGEEFEKVDALSALTGTQIPSPIAALKNAQVRFQNVCNKEDMGHAVMQLLHIDG